MNNPNLPLGYVGGDIMTHGSQLARQEECDKMEAAELPVTYYSPAQNKSINDKSHMTEEENNHLAERIVEADIERLWKSSFAVMCPEQSAIGTMCETAVLYAWKYMAALILNYMEAAKDTGKSTEDIYNDIYNELTRHFNRKNFFHYSDIRTNHLNEKDWRRSFSINQMLYGMILYASTDGVLHDNFDEVVEKLKETYKDAE